VKIEHVYVCGCARDLRFTQCCVASIRRWYPDIPITLLKDESDGPYSTRELEEAWDVGLFEGDRPVPGGPWAKLEPLFLPGRRRCLVLDSDIVFLGRVIERLEAVDADFVVESVGGWASLIGVHYFDLEGLGELDPEFVFPGYTFNDGQLVATSGLLRRDDFEPFVRFGAVPELMHKDVFAGIDQGVVNYVLLKKAQLGELRVERQNFMLWGWTRLPFLGPQAIRTGRLAHNSPYPYLVHWAGRKHKSFFLMRNRRLLWHFERYYYSHVSAGMRKRLWRSMQLG
jgi:hypothetical protein